MILRTLAALLLAAAAGCNTLPVIVPDMASHSSAPVQLDGAHGPLSAAQSKAILGRLKSHGEETSIFDRHLALEEGVSGTPLVVGNKVTLLQDGPATYQAMFDAISGAKASIHMESYIFEDDEVGRKFADALVAKRAQGVPVALIYDSVGSSNTPREFFKRLSDNGVQVLEFNPLNPLDLKKGWQVNARDHRKLLVIDGRTAFMGGVNISSVYSSGSFNPSSKSHADGSPTWRDTHLRVEGPVAAEFQKLFLDTWEKQKGSALEAGGSPPVAVNQGKEVVRAIGSSPDDPYSLIYATLISAINCAETSVYLTNAYFVPDPQLLAALKAAAARGVDVALVLPGTTDSWMVLNAGRSHYDDLLEAGVRIYERRGAMLHAKTAVIDGVWSTIGSTNLDWRSFLHNQEINAVVLGQEFGTRMQEMFEADLAESESITREAWAKRPLGDHVKETAARMWAQWL
jgi:cardiolipin synthase A/B